MQLSSFDKISQKYFKNVSRETFQQITAYVDLLIKWQKSVNLISNNTIDDIWQRHVLDSMQIYSYIYGDNSIAGGKSKITPQSKKTLNQPIKYDYIVDFGSGAGLPAVILAILLQGQGGGIDAGPDANLDDNTENCSNNHANTASQIYLIESDNKKCIFLNEVKKQLKLQNVRIFNKRIEQIAIDDLQNSSALFTARAFAPLKNILTLTEMFHVKHNLQNYACLLHKGEALSSEIGEAEKDFKFSYEVFPSISSDQGKIISISSVQS